MSNTAFNPSIQHGVEPLTGKAFNTPVNDLFRLRGMPKKTAKTERPIDVALQLAEEKGWNKSEFAGYMGVIPQHVTNWIKRGMPPERHAKAAEVLGVTVDRLLGRESAAGKLLCPHADIPQRHIDLIRMYQRLPDELRQPIRALIETLAYMNHEHKDEYVKKVTSFTPRMVQDKAKT